MRNRRSWPTVLSPLPLAGWVPVPALRLAPGGASSPWLPARRPLPKSRAPRRGWCLTLGLASTPRTGLSTVGLQRTPSWGNSHPAGLLLQQVRRALARFGRERPVGAVGIDETY